MKYRWDKKYLYWGITAFLVIVACMLAFAIVFRFDVVGNILGTVAKVLSPVFYGVVIAFLIDPVVRFIERMMARIFKKKRKTASFCNRIYCISRRTSYLSYFCGSTRNR